MIEDKRTDNDRQVRQDATKELVKHRGWKIVDGILSSQYQKALSQLRVEKTLEGFLSIQSTINQIEGLISQVKGEISDYGIKQVKKTLNIQDE